VGLFGQNEVSSNQLFTVDKTVIIISNTVGIDYTIFTINASSMTDSYFEIDNANPFSELQTDGVLNKTMIEIRVYP